MRHSLSEIVPSGAILLAPMAGITDAPFRGICREQGADLTYTEMISAAGLHHGGSSTHSRELLIRAENERPCAAQIFGSDPELLASAASIVSEDFGDDLALIDINMGCPVPKVVNKGEGSALMRDPVLAAHLVRAVVASVDVPITVKYRSGWDSSSVNAVEFGLALQEAGASGVAVHGRTRGQFYRGHADWSIIADVKKALDIPVYGSGDVFEPVDVVEMFEKTGVDAVMVARGAQGNPWIFSRAKALCAGLPDPGEPTPRMRLDTALRHAYALREFIGDHHAALRMRKHVMWYTHGLPGATHFRERVNASMDFAELIVLLEEYREYVS